jgi:hypothetical protein
MSTHNSKQGESYSMHSTPSPSPPSGTEQQRGAGRQRSKSGTGHLTMQQLNKKRQRATAEQLVVLEEAFHMNASPNAKMRELIAARISMTERSVQIWFQNRFVPGNDNVLMVVAPRSSRCKVRRKGMKMQCFILG